MEAETPPSARRVDGTPASRIRESGPPRRRTRDVATAAHCLPSGLSPSVQEFHLVNRPLAADGSRTVTAGSDFHRPRSALTSLVRAQCAMSISAGGRRPPCGLAHPPSTDPGSWPPVPAPRGADSPPRPFPNRGHGPRPPGSAGASPADAPKPPQPPTTGPTAEGTPGLRSTSRRTPLRRPCDAGTPQKGHGPGRDTRTHQPPTPRRPPQPLAAGPPRPCHRWGSGTPDEARPRPPGNPDASVTGRPKAPQVGRHLAVWGPVSGGAEGLPSVRGGGGRYPWAMLSSCSTAGRSAHRSPPGGAWSSSTAARASRSPASAAAWTMSLAA